MSEEEEEEEEEEERRKVLANPKTHSHLPCEGGREGGRENLFVESEGPKPQKLDWSSFQLAIIIRHRMDLTCTDIAPSAKISLADRDPRELAAAAPCLSPRKEKEKDRTIVSPPAACGRGSRRIHV